jgi:two-component system sensor histidine kinase KdpD
VVAAIAGMLASAFFFFPPLYSFQIRDSHEYVNLALFIFVAIVTSQLAMRLKMQVELARQREIDMRDLYDFSRRLAGAFDVSEIHAAIEDHLASVMQRNVALFSTTSDAATSSGRRAGVLVPEAVRSQVAEIAAGARDPASGATLKTDAGEVWLVRAVSPNSLEFGVIAINLGRASSDQANDLCARVNAVLADATATLERLGVAHAISEARMRSQTERLREALIGSVSHELRTPLASIMGAATVLGSAPALHGETRLKELVSDVHNEAERLNGDIQNLLDASRISSDGINPHTEWADPADIITTALDRCRRRLNQHRLKVELADDLPLIHVDPVLIQQALVQILDNAVKYSQTGSAVVVTARAEPGRIIIAVTDRGAGLTGDEKSMMWERFFRGERQTAITSGSGLGLWIASAFVAANGGKIDADSEGPGGGTTLSIELPVAQATVTQMESDADE